MGKHTIYQNHWSFGYGFNYCWWQAEIRVKSPCWGEGSSVHPKDLPGFLHHTQVVPRHFKASAFGTGGSEGLSALGLGLSPFRRSGGRKPSSTASEASVVSSCGGSGTVVVVDGRCVSGMAGGAKNECIIMKLMPKLTICNSYTVVTVVLDLNCLVIFGGIPLQTHRLGWPWRFGRYNLLKWILHQTCCWLNKYIYKYMMWCYIGVLTFPNSSLANPEVFCFLAKSSQDLSTITKSK